MKTTKDNYFKVEQGYVLVSVKKDIPYSLKEWGYNISSKELRQANESNSTSIQEHWIKVLGSTFPLEGVPLIVLKDELDILLEPFILDNGHLYCHNTPFLIKKIKELNQTKSKYKYTEEDIRTLVNSVTEFISHNEPEEFDEWFEKKLSKLNQPKEIEFEMDNNTPCCGIKDRSFCIQPICDCKNLQLKTIQHHTHKTGQLVIKQ